MAILAKWSLVLGFAAFPNMTSDNPSLSPRMSNCEEQKKADSDVSYALNLIIDDYLGDRPTHSRWIKRMVSRRVYNNSSGKGGYTRKAKNGYIND